MKHKLTLIKGGRPTPDKDNKQVFVDGNITNTRLMGVMSMELVWDVFRDNHIEKLYQLYYLDSEEYGIESCLEGYREDFHNIYEERDRVQRALGGMRVPISEKEALFILQTHKAIGEENGNPCVFESEVSFSHLFYPQVTLSRDEYLSLMHRISDHLINDYFTINYFMIRLVANDLRACIFLMGDHFNYPDTIYPDKLAQAFDFKLLDDPKPSTLCMNEIHPYPPFSYFCTTLVETDNQYRLFFMVVKGSEDTLELTNMDILANFQVSDAEATVIMAKMEYITVFDIDEDIEEGIEAIKNYTKKCTETEYENGTLYIKFKDNNNYIGVPTYHLNDDIYLLYFISEANQLIIASYDEDLLLNEEKLIQYTISPCTLTLCEKYAAKKPLIYEFIRGDYEYFEELIKLTQDSE